MKSKSDRFKKFREKNRIFNCLICSKPMNGQNHHCMCNTCHKINWNNSYWNGGSKRGKATN